MRVHQSNGADAMEWRRHSTHTDLCIAHVWPGRPDRQMLRFHVHSIWKVDWAKKITNHHHIYYKYNLHARSSRDMNITLLPCSAFYCFSLHFQWYIPTIFPMFLFTRTSDSFPCTIRYIFHFEETMLDDKCRQDNDNYSRSHSRSSSSGAQKPISNKVNGHSIACRLGNVCFALHNLCAICAIFHRVNWHAQQWQRHRYRWRRQRRCCRR